MSRKKAVLAAGHLVGRQSLVPAPLAVPVGRLCPSPPEATIRSERQELRKLRTPAQLVSTLPCCCNPCTGYSFQPAPSPLPHWPRPKHRREGGAAGDRPFRTWRHPLRLWPHQRRHSGIRASTTLRGCGGRVAATRRAIPQHACVEHRRMSQERPGDLPWERRFPLALLLAASSVTTA